MNIMTFQAEQVSQAAVSIMSTGVVGACLIALAVWHVLLARRYEYRINEMFKREREFQDTQASATEKYRVAMENVAKTLDVVVTLIRER